MAEWNPSAPVQAVLDQVDGVLAEYEEHLPLTIRQIFYRLVGNHGFEKTEAAYSRLAEYMNRARRSGRIPFESIRDDGVTSSEPHGFSSAASFWSSIAYWADDFRLHRLAGQDEHIEVWVEAAGMVPQVARVAHEYGISVYSSSGFNSTTAKHDTAERLSDHSAATVLHVGDLDPSGVAIFDSLSEDVTAFLDDMAPGSWVTFERIAVTEDQVAFHDLTTSPPKKTDRRSNYQGPTAQVEALPPDVLAELVRAAILDHIDEELWSETVERETSEREALVSKIDELAL